MLLFVFFSPVLTQAVVYDTKFQDWYEVNEMVENTELQEGKIEKRYRFYQEQLEYAPYYTIKEQSPKDYPFQSEKSILTEFTEWSLEKPESYSERVIESKQKYFYQTAKKVSSLTFYQVDGSEDKLWLTEIEVLYQGEKVPYEVECETCSETLKNNIQNNKPYERAEFLFQGEVLKLNFQTEYDLKDLTVHVFVGDLLKTKLTQYQIGVNDDYDSNHYVHVSRAYWSGSSLGGAYQDTIVLKNNVEKMNWEDEVQETEEILEESPWLNLVEIKNYYRYQDQKYLFYRVSFNYLDGYHLEKEGYIKDEEDFILVYWCRKKDRIVVKDKIEITKNYLDLDDIILESTIPLANLTIKNNINWNITGDYEVQISYDDLHISVPIKVLKMDVDSISEDSNSKKTENMIVSKETEEKKAIASKSYFTEKAEIDNPKQVVQKGFFTFFSFRTISLLILFLLGIFLVVYSLNKSVERKK